MSNKPIPFQPDHIEGSNLKCQFPLLTIGEDSCMTTPIKTAVILMYRTGTGPWMPLSPTIYLNPEGMIPTDILRAVPEDDISEVIAHDIATGEATTLALAEGETAGPGFAKFPGEGEFSQQELLEDLKEAADWIDDTSTECGQNKAAEIRAKYFE
mgnify:CR=1 FL=1|tara:strand:+ start:193 stop:657 length:465 start_codon:yes stop_codon:yes gene_type:complete